MIHSGAERMLAEERQRRFGFGDAPFQILGLELGVERESERESPKPEERRLRSQSGESLAIFPQPALQPVEVNARAPRPHSRLRCLTLHRCGFRLRDPRRRYAPFFVPLLPR